MGFDPLKRFKVRAIRQDGGAVDRVGVLYATADAEHESRDDDQKCGEGFPVDKPIQQQSNSKSCRDDDWYEEDQGEVVIAEVHQTQPGGQRKEHDNGCPKLKVDSFGFEG